MRLGQRSRALVSLLVLSTPFVVMTARAAPADPELFVDLHGTVGAGILFDGRGNLLVGKEGEVVKITPAGKVSTFCSLRDLPAGKNYYYPSPLVWDMAIDRDGNILAAAQDRILKMASDGTVTTIIREDFAGFVGASAVELDRAGNMYVPDGDRIWKYSPRLERTVFIDGANAHLKVRTRRGPFRGSDVPLEVKSIVSLEFDPEFKNLYVSDYGSKVLLRYPIAPEGTPGDPEVLFDPYTDELYRAPLNIVFGDRGTVYASQDIEARLFQIDATGRKDRIALGTIRNHMIAFGGAGFDEESIYFTTVDGKVYRRRVGERAAPKSHAP